MSKEKKISKKAQKTEANSEASGQMNGHSHGASGEEEQKKNKRAVEDVDDADDQERKARKKAKKEAKRQAKLAAAAKAEEQVEADEATPMEEEKTAGETEEEEERKRRKKVKKGKKKAARLAAEAAEAAAATTAGNGHVDREEENDDSDKKPIQKTTTAGSSKLTKEEEVQAWWEKHEILVGGSRCDEYPPVLDFADAAFPADLLKCTKGFSKPTPIQSQCWPVLNGERDIIGIAETGSGKTLTFALPGLVHIRKAKGNNKKHLPRMLVVAPTRELAMQSAEVLESVVKGLDLTSTCLFGGVNKHDQRKILRQGVDIVVATPGRLADLVEEGECDLSQVTYLVLDEADRMLDQGFEQAIRGIIACTATASKGRQTALFSATWPQSIQELAQEFLVDPIKVTIGGEDLSSNKRVTQVVEVVAEFDRERLLKGLLQKYHASRENRVLVFALYKKEAARLEQSLQRQGFNCLGIHGDKSQTDRMHAVQCFKTKEVPLLIATDVAARGLDIPDVEVVINFSFPLTIEDYVHRIGRTGRAGKSGIAHTFFHQGDKGNAGALVNTLRQAEQEVPSELLKFGCAVKKKEHKLYGAFAKDGVDMSKKPTKIVFGDDD